MSDASSGDVLTTTSNPCRFRNRSRERCPERIFLILGAVTGSRFLRAGRLLLVTKMFLSHRADSPESHAISIPMESLPSDDFRISLDRRKVGITA